MSWLLLDERSATIVAIVMLVVCAVGYLIGSRWSRWISTASFETAIICALFALWQAANSLTRGRTEDGLARGRDVWRFERWIHLPNERVVQNLILPHPDLVRAVNYYYDTAHLTLMVVFLVWLWLRHRDRYPFIRNMLAFFTGMSLLVQMVSVAPPRLIGGTGLVDTAALYGQSVYAVIGSNIADQYAAMPSIHVGWAMLISYAVVTVSDSRWRWVAALYGPLTLFVVVATANHYWLDGVAAIVLLVVAYFMAIGVAQLRARRPANEAETAPAQIQQGALS
jgi:PAP2 superfamily